MPSAQCPGARCPVPGARCPEPARQRKGVKGASEASPIEALAPWHLGLCLPSAQFTQLTGRAIPLWAFARLLPLPPPPPNSNNLSTTCQAHLIRTTFPRERKEKTMFARVAGARAFAKALRVPAQRQQQQQVRRFGGESKVERRGEEPPDRDRRP